MPLCRTSLSATGLALLSLLVSCTKQPSAAPLPVVLTLPTMPRSTVAQCQQACAVGEYCLAGSCRIEPVAAIAAGALHVCTVRAGEVYCWGDNRAGQAGTSGADGLQRSPQRIAGVNDALDIAADDFTSCALHRTGKVSCWGEPLGPQAIEMPHFENAVRLAVGNGTLCTAQASGQVQCSARIGRAEQQSAPRLVAGINNAIDVAVGYGFACALESGGLVDCWSNYVSNRRGEELPEHPKKHALRVSGVSDVIALRANSGRACAIERGGRVLCWAPDPQAFWSVDEPLTFEAHDFLVASNARAFSFAGETMCFVRADGTFACSNSGATPEADVGVQDAIAVAAGGHLACFVHASGKISCEGSNEFAELGNGDASFFGEPVEAEGVADVVEVAVFGHSTCVRLKSGQVACFGMVDRHGLTLSLMKQGNVPVLVPGLSDATGLAAVQNTGFCASRANGDDVCWSPDGPPQPVAVRTRGSGIRRLPKVQQLPDAVSLAGELYLAADYQEKWHACAVRKSGAAACFSGALEARPTARGAAARWLEVPNLKHAVQIVNANERGMLAGGQFYARTADGKVFSWTFAQPTAVAWPYASDVVAMAGSKSGVCVVERDGSVACEAQLRPHSEVINFNGGRSNNVYRGRVAGIADAIAVAVGEEHVCAVTRSGKLWCWGSNLSGSLARHEVAFSEGPLDVIGLPPLRK